MFLQLTNGGVSVTSVNFQSAHGTGMEQSLLSLNQDTDKIETNIYASFIIHDFDVSWNNQIITEEICAENMDTIIGQPVLVKYFNEGQRDKDHLGTHEAYMTTNRDTGENMLATDTFAIGTFQSVEITDIQMENETKRCLVGKAQLWINRYYNVCSLLNEWLENGVHIYCSCEYVFKNYEMKDSVQYIKSPYSYTGHTILNSEEKDGYGVVLPAYDAATMVSWNTALNEDLKNNRSKNCEGKKLENVFINAMNELSMGETRSKIYDALANIMTAAEFEYMWLSDWQIFEDYFVYETYDKESKKWKYYKVNYSKTDDNVIVDYENKTEVAFETVLVEVQKANNQLQVAVNEVKGEYETKISELNSELSSEKEKGLTQKEDIISLNEQITDLKNMIASLNEYKEKFEAEQYQTALNKVLESYKNKFAKLNALDKFEEESVQVLISDTLDAEKTLEAKNMLSDILIDLIDNVPVQASMNAKHNTSTFVEPGSGIGNFNKDSKKVIKDTDIYDGKIVV